MHLFIHTRFCRRLERFIVWRCFIKIPPNKTHPLVVLWHQETYISAGYAILLAMQRTGKTRLPRALTRIGGDDPPLIAQFSPPQK